MPGKDWARANLFKGGGTATGALAAEPHAWLGGLVLGPARMLGALELAPLIHPDAAGQPDLLALDALAAGWLDLREKDGGTVQELIATNRASRPLVLFEGEILLGARQNRMVAHTVVIAPGATVVIPVGCVERGRWHWTSPGFSGSPCVAEAALRRSAKASVAASRTSGRGVVLDQPALWSEVEAALECGGLRSPTSDYTAVQRERAADAEAAARVAPVERQVGVMALREGRLVAIDLVGSSGTWTAVAGRILRSLLPASAGRTVRAPAPGRSSGEWLSVLQAARLILHPALGLGQDVALEAPGLIGSGVWLERGPAHLSAFAPA